MAFAYEITLGSGERIVGTISAGVDSMNSAIQMVERLEPLAVQIIVKKLKQENRIEINDFRERKALCSV